jgi:hypothetical protein
MPCALRIYVRLYALLRPLTVPGYCAVCALQRLDDTTGTGLQVLTARDGLIGFAKARFDSKLVIANKR